MDINDLKDTYPIFINTGINTDNNLIIKVIFVSTLTIYHNLNLEYVV